MAKGKIDVKEKLRSYKFKLDLLQKIPCSKEENKEFERLLKDGGVLPDGVFAYEDLDGEPSKTEFYTIYEPDLTDAEIAEYLSCKQVEMIRTIKNCVVFFTVLTIIGMVAFFLILLNGI